MLSNFRRSGICTPKFACKKVQRPQTKHLKKRPVESYYSGTSSMDSRDVAKPGTIKSAKKTADALHKKPESLLDSEMTSNFPTDGGLDTLGGNFLGKLNIVVDKLQDQEWQV